MSARAAWDAPRRSGEIPCPPRPADPVTRTFLIRYAGVSSRADSPSVFVLLARGFVIEAVDERYDTFVMRKDITE